MPAAGGRGSSSTAVGWWPACAAIALAKPTASTLTTKNAFIQPVLDAACDQFEERVARLVVAERLAPAWPAGWPARSGAMNRNATMNSAPIIARPAGFFLPVDSSASVEIPSKPRKLSTAIDSAAAISGALTVSEFQIGVVLQPHVWAATRR